MFQTCPCAGQKLVSIQALSVSDKHACGFWKKPATSSAGSLSVPVDAALCDPDTESVHHRRSPWRRMLWSCAQFLWHTPDLIRSSRNLEWCFVGLSRWSKEASWQLALPCAPKNWPSRIASCQYGREIRYMLHGLGPHIAGLWSVAVAAMHFKQSSLRSGEPSAAAMNGQMSIDEIDEILAYSVKCSSFLRQQISVF